MTVAFGLLLGWVLLSVPTALVVCRTLRHRADVDTLTVGGKDARYRDLVSQ